MTALGIVAQKRKECFPLLLHINLPQLWYCRGGRHGLHEGAGEEPSRRSATQWPSGVNRFVCRRSYKIPGNS